MATDDFIRLGKDKVEGTVLAAGPMLVIDEIADSNPIKKRGAADTSTPTRSSSAQKPATFGANTWDAGLLLERAIPAALGRRKPGTEAFRVGTARRASSRSAKSSACQGVFNMSADEPQRHGRARARARDRAGDGKFRLLPE